MIVAEPTTPAESAPLAACLNHTEQALLVYYKRVGDVLRVFGWRIDVQTLEGAGVATGEHGVVVTHHRIGVEYVVTITPTGLRYRAACMEHSGPCRCLGLRVARFFCRWP